MFHNSNIFKTVKGRSWKVTLLCLYPPYFINSHQMFTPHFFVYAFKVLRDLFSHSYLVTWPGRSRSNLVIEWEIQLSSPLLSIQCGSSSHKLQKKLIILGCERKNTGIPCLRDSSRTLPYSKLVQFSQLSIIICY